MSRTPASFTIAAVRGATVEEEFTYTNPDESPFDLTGYEARMQIRTLAGQYGLTTAATLVMEATIDNERLRISDPETGVVELEIDAEDTVDLNPLNAKKHVLCYSLELFKPAGADPEYVIPLVKGKLSIQGETTR